MEESIADYVKRVVDRAPELTDEHVIKLRALLLRPPMDHRQPRPPDIYFVRADSPTGEIKIGKSTFPRGRLLSLQTGSAYPLEIVALIPEGGDELEQELHVRFAHLRMAGEWFRPGADLWAYIETLEART